MAPSCKIQPPAKHRSPGVALGRWRLAKHVPRSLPWQAAAPATRTRHQVCCYHSPEGPQTFTPSFQRLLCMRVASHLQWSHPALRHSCSAGAALCCQHRWSLLQAPLWPRVSQHHKDPKHSVGRMHATTSTWSQLRIEAASPRHHLFTQKKDRCMPRPRQLNSRDSLSTRGQELRAAEAIHALLATRSNASTQLLQLWNTSWQGI